MRNLLRSALGLASTLLLVGCRGEAGEPPRPGVEREPDSARRAEPAFVDRAAEIGLDFVHFNGRSGEYYLDEITCGGGAFIDADGDGDLDVYLVQGTILGRGKTMADALDPPAHPIPLSDRLYRNDLAEGEGLHFTDVTEASGLDRLALRYGCGVAAGDVDNDGRIDLYVLNLGPNQLLHNNGDGTFGDVTAEAGVGLGDSGSAVAGVFFDYDRDGWLDLFVGNNVTFDDTGKTRCHSLTGAIDYCGPAAYPPQADRLFHNLGGRFEDVTRASGLAAAPARPTLGAVAGDFDGDGWLDLYVANDGEPNNLWRNRGDGTFEDLGIVSGSAVNAMGAAEASMGVDAADFDGDGDLDLFMAHLIKETNTLFVNDGGGRFVDATATAALSAPSLPYTSFGTGFFDLENDGWLDLLLVNGAVTNLPELVRAGDPMPLHQSNQLFHNLGPDRSGRVRYEEAPRVEGDPLALSEVSRAAAFGDVDNDGDTDVLVVNNGGPVRLLVNRVGQDRPWIGARALVELGEDGVAFRDEPGAMVALVRGGRTVAWRRAHTDGSYNAASDPRVLFGLGAERMEGEAQGDPPAVDGLRVVWPNGQVEDFVDLPLRTYSDLVHTRGREVAR